MFSIRNWDAVNKTVVSVISLIIYDFKFVQNQRVKYDHLLCEVLFNDHMQCIFQNKRGFILKCIYDQRKDWKS